MQSDRSGKGKDAGKEVVSESKGCSGHHRGEKPHASRQGKCRSSWKGGLDA